MAHACRTAARSTAITKYDREDCEIRTYAPKDQCLKLSRENAKFYLAHSATSPELVAQGGRHQLLAGQPLPAVTVPFLAPDMVTPRTGASIAGVTTPAGGGELVRREPAGASCDRSAQEGHPARGGGRR